MYAASGMACVFTDFFFLFFWDEIYLYIDSEVFISVDFWKRGLPQPPSAGGLDTQMTYFHLVLCLVVYNCSIQEAKVLAINLKPIWTDYVMEPLLNTKYLHIST